MEVYLAQPRGFWAGVVRAIIPLLQGVLADRIGIHHAFILPAICYLYIAYFAFKGSRPVVPA